jgi:poly-gamma-glutamate capsule biosynthesis protein CapA/YwtB (metallophosphatase superfamily)
MRKETTYNQKKIWLLRIICVAAFCCVVLLGIKAFGGIFLAPPTWVVYESKTLDAGHYSLGVKDKRAILSMISEPKNEADKNSDTKSTNDVLWISPSDYKVQDGFLSDVDRDGNMELVLLLWKRGRFGKHRPFWVLSDEKSYSQHIFIYDIVADKISTDASNTYDNAVKQKWFASDIGIQIRRMKLMERDNAIILTEDTDGNNALWQWQSFGLKSMNNEVKFVAFGDNIIHREIYEYAQLHEGGNFDFLYEPFKDEIEDADVAMVNAETVLVDKESAVSGYPQFGSPLEVGQALKNAGFDVVSCANNHALDKGIYGIDVTSSFYRNNNMTCVGIQGSNEKSYRPMEIIKRNGMKIAVLSYTYGTNDIDVSDKYHYAVHYLPQLSVDSTFSDSESKAAEDIISSSGTEENFVDEVSLAGDEADFVVVFVHWGDEYQKEVSDYQRGIADLLSKAGADVVIGTHPHVVQETELLDRPDGGKMLVYYSLGNFRAYQKGKDSGGIESLNDKKNIGGAEALFTIEYTYDGVRLKNWDLKDIDSYAP